MTSVKVRYFVLPLVAFMSGCGPVQPEGCILPPAGFSTADLVGTWYDVSGSAGDEDTLIIRADGTYRQMTQVDSQAFNYKSDWLPWRLELGPNGLPYLHLIGMRLCAYGGDCGTVGGGSGRNDLWYDACQKKWVAMPGEGVLIVQGAFVLNRQTPQPPTIQLYLLRRGEDTWGYAKRGIPPPTPTGESP